jgi:Integrase core domain
VRAGEAIQLFPQSSPTRQTIVHDSDELVIVTPNQQVDKFMQHDAFTAICRLLRQRGIGWNLSSHCRTEDALVEVERAVLEGLPEGKQRGEYDTHYFQQHSVYFLPLPGDAGGRASSIAARLPSPGGQRLHRTVQSQFEGKGWTTQYRGLEEARACIARWNQEYNHNRPHRGVGDRALREAFLSFATELKSEVLTV